MANGTRNPWHPQNMTSAAPPWKNGRHVNPTSSDVMPAACRIGPVPTQRHWVRSTPPWAGRCPTCT